jgi:MFS family permease
MSMLMNGSFAWGVVLALHATVTNFISLLVVRFCLGALESAISPGFSLITGMWYIPREHNSRHLIWFAGNASGSIVGSLVVYGMLHYEGSMPPWKVSPMAVRLTALMGSRSYLSSLAPLPFAGPSFFGSCYLTHLRVPPSWTLSSGK